MDKICIGLISFLTVFLSCKAPKCQRKGEQIGKEDLLKMGEKHIAVVREAVNVRVWDKVRYGSEDVEATANAKTVSVTDADMLTYILFD